MAPCLNVSPCAACEVAANAGATGSWVRLIRRTDSERPLSKYQELLLGAIGYSPGSRKPGRCQ
eukprot:6533043-Karenia_brevis.AAC.1